MAEDLYSSWLDLPPGDRPPDHYTLLGVARFCTDLSAIDAAAHGRLDRLDRYALHPDPEKREACTRLMNMVAQARVVLSTPQLRRPYDKKLARQAGMPLTEIPEIEPEAAAPPAPEEIDSSSAPAPDVIPDQSQPEGPRAFGLTMDPEAQEYRRKCDERELPAELQYELWDQLEKWLKAREAKDG